MKDIREQKTGSAHEKEPLRLLALSDGLFATVLTVLVLDLRIPDALITAGGNSTAFIKWLGPHLFSYLLTFLVGGTYWLAHHRYFDLVERYDRGLLGYNLLFLLFIGLFPFSTATLSLTSFKFIEFPFYWAIYAANIIIAGVMLNMTWTYAASHHLVTSEMTRRQGQHITLRMIVTPAIFLISIVAGFIFPQAFLVPFTLLVIPVVQWVVDRIFSDADPRRPSTNSGWVELLWRAGIIIPWLLVIGLAIWAMNL